MDGDEKKVYNELSTLKNKITRKRIIYEIAKMNYNKESKFFWENDIYNMLGFVESNKEAMNSVVQSLVAIRINIMANNIQTPPV